MDENNTQEMSMEEAMKGFSLNKVKDGDILEGKIIKVNKDEVIVNINYFCDGVIPREELTDNHHEDITETYHMGDAVKVIVLKADDGDGNVLLSKLKADAIVATDDVVKALKDKKPLKVLATEVVKGGLRISYNGLSGFMPASLVSDTYVENLKEFEGKTLDAMVEEFDEEERKLIFSRKAFIKTGNEEKKKVLLETLKEGTILEGTVQSLTSYGAFIDLGGMTGLAHISELSYKRIDNPNEVVSVGDKVKVYVLKVDKKKEKISLSLKNIEDDPWLKVHDLKVGGIYEATVKRLIDAGAIVALENGLDGLVHISEISSEPVTNAADVLKVGEKVKVKLLHIDDDKKRVSFSIREGNDKDESYYEEEDAVTLGDLFKDLMDKFKEEK